MILQTEDESGKDVKNEQKQRVKRVRISGGRREAAAGRRGCLINTVEEDGL